MNDSRGTSNWLVTILAIVLIVLVVGAISVLGYQYYLLRQVTPTPVPAGPVQVTRIVPGTYLTPVSFPTLPPVWTDTPVPTLSPTEPTATPTETETPTLTPTFPDTDTPAPTLPGPTHTHAPTWTPTFTPTFTPSATSSAPPPVPLTANPSEANPAGLQGQ